MKPEWSQWKERSRWIWASIPLLVIGVFLILIEFENPAGDMPRAIARFVFGTMLTTAGTGTFMFCLFCRWKYKKAYRDVLPRP